MFCRLAEQGQEGHLIALASGSAPSGWVLSVAEVQGWRQRQVHGYADASAAVLACALHMKPNKEDEEEAKAAETGGEGAPHRLASRFAKDSGRSEGILLKCRKLLLEGYEGVHVASEATMEREKQGNRGGRVRGRRLGHGRKHK